MNASTIKVGDRLLICTGNHWIWRREIRHRATVKQIENYVGVGFQIGKWEYSGFRFRVCWDHRRWGIFRAYAWISTSDIEGVVVCDKEAQELERMMRQQP